MTLSLDVACWAYPETPQNPFSMPAIATNTTVVLCCFACTFLDFSAKMRGRLVAELHDQFMESARLESAILTNLARLGFPLKTTRNL